MPDGYACVRVDSRGTRAVAGLRRPFSAAREPGLLRVHRVGGGAALEQRQGRAARHLLLRHEPVAGGGRAAAAPGGDLPLGGRRGLVPRHDPPRRHPLDLLGQLVRQAGEDRSSTGSASAAPAIRSPGSPCAGSETLFGGSVAEARTDFGEEIRSPIRSTTTTTASAPPTGRGSPSRCSRPRNWGGQGLHPRGNFEGYTAGGVRPEVARGPRLEHWTDFYTDYGVEIQKRFFGHFLKGEDNGWDEPAAGAAAGPPRSTGPSSSAPSRRWPIARTEWTRAAPRPRRGPALRHGRAGRGDASVGYEALGDGLTFMADAAGRGDRDHRALWRAAVRLLRRPPTPTSSWSSGVFDPDGEELVFTGALDPHTPVGAGLAAGLAPRARPRALRAVPARSTPTRTRSR